jgi:hypothetical protein
VGVKKRETFAGHEVLPDEIEQQGTFAGAGLSDDVEVPAAFFGIEHDGLARDAGTDAELLMLQCHGQKGAGVPCAPRRGSWCGQHPPSARVRRGCVASSSFVRGDLDCRTPRSLPARFRPRSFRDRGLPRLYRRKFGDSGVRRG